MKVVASIKPVHSLAAAIMQGVGQPQLLMEGNASPHTFAMRPSQARQLQSADLVFWVGPGLETFLEKPLFSLGNGKQVVTLAQIPELTLWDYRTDGPYEAHDHGGDDREGHEHHHGHAHAHAHAHEDSHAHNHAHHHESRHNKHDRSHDHDHGKPAAAVEKTRRFVDMHVWLDTANARIMARKMAASLSAADPANAARYASNLQALDAQLQALTTELGEQLAVVRGRPFIVFHDAYQYMERQFGLKAVGSVTVSPEVMPGAARVAQIRTRIRESGAQCVFAEPQFEPRIIQTLVEGTQAKVGTLNPVGGELPAGPGFYAELMRQNAHALVQCLQP